MFHGIQATLVAQQMAMRQQLEGMRGQLPEGGPQGPAGPAGASRTGAPGGGSAAYLLRATGSGDRFEAADFGRERRAVSRQRDLGK